MEEQTNLKEAYKLALRKAGCTFLAEGTILEELIPRIQEAGIDPNLIEKAEDTRFFFVMDDNGAMRHVLISDHEGKEFIGNFLGIGIAYKQAVAILKARGEPFGYDLLYGMVKVFVTGGDHLDCYYPFAFGKRTRIDNEFLIK